MPGSDLQSWNQRYLAGEFGFRETDPFVMEAHKKYLQPMLRENSAAGSNTGLDLAGGAGHHAIWLAQQGWRMALADWSEPALEIAREKAAAGQLMLDIQQGTALDVVSAYASNGRRFGFVLVSFFLDREVLPWLPRILIPGGLLLYRTYTEDNERLGNPRGPRDPRHLLRSQELLEIYRGMKILHYNETVAQKGVAELIAQKMEISPTNMENRE
ncbi:MAG TPA: class I SAM-dependent methyltransferase [Acidobacteriaceae bacterium]|nr:class I SAM-dependent methyltransferase [Acidobacteriaceae bacterium]